MCVVCDVCRVCCVICVSCVLWAREMEGMESEDKNSWRRQRVFGEEKAQRATVVTCDSVRWVI